MATPALSVWLGGRVVAVLSRHRGDLSLEYLSEEVSQVGTGSIVLSVSMPVRSKPYVRDAVQFWLEGLLPEGEARTTLEAMHDVRRGDTFGLLEAIGRECAGAVSFLPEDSNPIEPEIPDSISLGELAKAIDDLPIHPLGATEESGISLGGLQSKLLLCRSDNGWAWPRGGTISTHILKPEPVQHPGLAPAEHYAMRLATEAGINAAHVELVKIKGRSVLVIERFDRKTVNGKTQRVHQEDSCQALGLDARDRKKYQEQSGGPSYGQLAKLLKAHAKNVQEELRNLAESMVLNVAVGNTDAHGKNHGFLIENGTISFAPVYDVSPTVSFVSRRQLALFVGGEYRLDRVSKIHLALEAQSWGLSKNEAIDVVEDATSRVLTAIVDHRDGEETEAIRNDVLRCATRLSTSGTLSVEAQVKSRPSSP